MVEELHSVDAVLDALGGNRGVAAIFGRTDPAISNWRKAGQFPAYTYITLSEELEKIGKRAPHSLWAWETKHKRVETAQ
jgi:hypothetical protein